MLSFNSLRLFCFGGTGFVAILLIFCTNIAKAQVELGEAPINYLTAKSNDPVAQFMAKMESGESNLKFDAGQGYLSSALKEFDVHSSSQVLVFSKTSLQLKYISPQTPRTA